MKKGNSWFLKKKKQNERGNKKKVECNTVQCKTGLWVSENQKEMERRNENQNELRYQVEKREKETTYDNNCFGKKKKKKEENGQWGTN